MIERMVNWTDPGPGGFYDDLGNPAMQPHLVRSLTFGEDPGFLRRSFTGFARLPWRQQAAGWRTSWLTDAESFYDTPVATALHGIGPFRAVPGAHCLWRRTFSDAACCRLTASDTYVVQPERRIEDLAVPVEFDIPRELTLDGELTLSWSKPPGMGGNGRGCQIAEVWLLRR